LAGKAIQLLNYYQEKCICKEVFAYMSVYIVGKNRNIFLSLEGYLELSAVFQNVDAVILRFLGDPQKMFCQTPGWETLL
jgi:hypothetical protein